MVADKSREWSVSPPAAKQQEGGGVRQASTRLLPIQQRPAVEGSHRVHVVVHLVCLPLLCSRAVTLHLPERLSAPCRGPPALRPPARPSSARGLQTALRAASSAGRLTAGRPSAARAAAGGPAGPCSCSVLLGWRTSCRSRYGMCEWRPVPQYLCRYLFCDL